MHIPEEKEAEFVYNMLILPVVYFVLVETVKGQDVLSYVLEALV